MSFSSENWWREFFNHRHSLDLSQFPDAEQTQREVAGLVGMLNLTADQRIADVCCGYGRHLIPLTRRGYTVFGVEIAPLMVKMAHQRLREAGVEAAIIRADARQMPFAGGSLDVVLNLFNSFGYCQSDAQNQLVLNETARVLRPGGKLLLDTRNRQQQIIFAPRHLPAQTSDGQHFVLKCRYDRSHHCLISQWHRSDGGPVIHTASIRLYGIEELDEMMANAGLRKVDVYGDYDGTRFAGYQRQLLYLAEKTGRQ